MARTAQALGWQFMPWQRQVADVAAEIDLATGEWAHPVVVLTVQRQAGKTVLVDANAVHRCLSGVDRYCWYTQQDRQHARQTILKLIKRIRRSPLRPPFSRPRESNGSEAIRFPTGSEYAIFAPSDDALHSTTNALVNVDESWTFDEVRGRELLQAIMPTFATVDGQLWIISAGGTAASTWLRGLVDAGRLAAQSGATTGMAYFEWSIGDDIDPADLAAVAAAHPAHGYTLRPRALQEAAALMDPDEFARAYGNRWTGAQALTAIPALLWSLAPDTLTPLPGPGGCALAFEVGRDGADAAVMAGWRDPAGTGHLELLDYRPGASWLPARLAELQTRLRPRATWYDRLGPAVEVGDACARAKVKVHACTFDDRASADPALLRGLADRTLRVRPHPALDAAAGAVGRRQVGDRWVFDRAGPVSVAPIIAGSVALRAFDQTPAPARFRIR